MTDNTIIELRGHELHIIERILNRQESKNINDHFTKSDISELTNRSDYPSDFIETLENKGLIYYCDNCVYITDLAKRSLVHKHKIELKAINQNIFDDYQYAVLEFFYNRNEPVYMFYYPEIFKQLSPIHGKKVDGSESTYYTWETDFEKFIIHRGHKGMTLNDGGKIYFEKLKEAKEYKKEKERLELQSLRSKTQIETEMILDYPRLKKERNITLLIAILSILANIVLGFIKAK